MSGENVILSASKLKTIKACSWLYYCTYILKLPQIGNDGSKRGQCVHNLYECLLKPSRVQLYNQIIDKGTIRSIPLVERFIKTKMAKEGITTEFDNKGNNNFDLIDQMILVGLRHDFYCESGELEKAETEFNYTNDELGYTIRGFIDKISNHGDHLKIHDYKTSAQQFSGDDLYSNVQAMMYSLYAKRVRNMDAVVRFIFLRFEDNPIQELKFNEKSLFGFEQYLSFITKYLKNFGIKEAQENFAAHKPYPKKEDGFSGKLICGYGKFHGHAKKTGEVYYVCPMKWGFSYYALVNKETKEIIKTSFKKSDLKESDESVIENRVYDGCPAWTNSKTY